MLFVHVESRIKHICKLPKTHAVRIYHSRRHGRMISIFFTVRISQFFGFATVRIWQIYINTDLNSDVFQDTMSSPYCCVTCQCDYSTFTGVITHTIKNHGHDPLMFIHQQLDDRNGRVKKYTFSFEVTPRDIEGEIICHDEERNKYLHFETSLGGFTCCHNWNSKNIDP